MSFWKKLYWCIFKWRIPYARDEELVGVDAFVTQAAWKLQDRTAGPGNKLLADSVERIHGLYPHKTIIAQDVVAEVLHTRGIPVVSIQKSEHEAYANSSLEWNTFEVSRRQYEICKRQNIQKIAFVAMPDHEVRSYLTYLRVGFRTIKAVAVDSKQVHYHHPESLYWVMRGRRWRYVLREFCARILFLLTRRI